MKTATQQEKRERERERERKNEQSKEMEARQTSLFSEKIRVGRTRARDPTRRGLFFLCR
jgi:hypothetical protein